jgi:hypothetical protein
MVSEASTKGIERFSEVVIRTAFENVRAPAIDFHARFDIEGGA